MLGEWRSLGNPCTGASELERTFTYFAQPTHVLPLQGHPGRFIFMADQWDSDNLAASRCAPPLACIQALAGGASPGGQLSAELLIYKAAARAASHLDAQQLGAMGATVWAWVGTALAQGARLCRYVWLPLWVLAVPPAVQKRMQQREGGLEARLSRSPGMKPSLPPSQVDVVVRWHSIWQLSDFERVPNTRYEQLVPG